MANERRLWERAAMAFVLVLWLTLLVGTVVLVGGFDLAPRPAALAMLGPSIVCGAAAAALRPTREFFAKLLTLG